MPPPPSMQKFLYKILLLLLKRKKERKKERRRARRYIAEEGKRPLRGRRCKRTVTFSDLIYAIDCGTAVMRSDGDSIERSARHLEGRKNKVQVEA